MPNIKETIIIKIIVTKEKIERKSQKNIAIVHDSKSGAIEIKSCSFNF